MKIRYLTILTLLFSTVSYANEAIPTPKVNAIGASLSEQEITACYIKHWDHAQQTDIGNLEVDMLKGLAVDQCMAEKGDIGAMISVANRYWFGVTRENLSGVKDALHWYHKAVAAGDTLSMFNLGSIYLVPDAAEYNQETGFYWMKKAAERRVVDAYVELARLYAQGIGTEKNLEQAKIWLERARQLNIAIPDDLKALAVS